MDLVSLKTRKLPLHSFEPFKCDHKSADMRLLWVVFVTSVFLFLYFYYYEYVFFFQGKEEDSDKMIRMKRATPLFSEDVVLDQGTGMIETATAADDKEVLVILHSMKSVVSHFVGDKKIFEHMRVETGSP